MTDAKFWDDLYGEQERRWSGRPNVAFERIVAPLPPGRALDLGCGEGADAVWLAARGWRVTAIDISRVALDRAEGHAKEAGVADAIDFQLRDLLADGLPPGAFDLVSVQFLPVDRVLSGAAAAVAPGGTLLIEGHADHGPYRHPAGHPHHDVSFPTPDELVRDLGLNSPDWDLVRAELHERRQIGPDGVEVSRTDSTVQARRVR